jgi:uncharacterized membrane protein YfcA
MEERYFSPKSFLIIITSGFSAGICSGLIGLGSVLKKNKKYLNKFI